VDPDHRFGRMDAAYTAGAAPLVVGAMRGAQVIGRDRFRPVARSRTRIGSRMPVRAALGVSPSAGDGPSKGSVVAIGHDGRIVGVCITGGDCRLRGRCVQDCVATRGIFLRVCHGGPRAGIAHNGVVGGLGAGHVSLWLVSPSRGACYCDLLMKPVRRLKAHNGARWTGSQGWCLGAAHQHDNDTDGHAAFQLPGGNRSPCRGQSRGYQMDRLR
jgi:hypothetical protein